MSYEKLIDWLLIVSVVVIAVGWIIYVIRAALQADELERRAANTFSGKFADCGCALAVGGWAWHGPTCRSLK